ncbi:MAG: winged helix-turn-helix transcriptional regulator [Candidatus Hodarchaeales archaeon]|jgi:hypothetical protein
MTDPAIKHLLAAWHEMSTFSSQERKKTTKNGLLGATDYRWLEKEAQHFWEAFGDRSEVAWDDVHWHSKRSVRIHGGKTGWSILYPWSLYVDSLRGWGEEVRNDLTRKMTLIPKLQQLPAFIELLARQRLSNPFPLKPTIVKVIQALAKVKTYPSSPKYALPTNDDLERVVNAKKRAIQDAMHYLSIHSIYDPIYLINYAKLGFDGVLVEHSHELPAHLLPYTVRSREIFWDWTISIIYFPRLSKELKSPAFDSFARQTDPLTSYQFTWNLEGLTVKARDRWLAEASLFQEPTPPPRGLVFDLQPRESPTLTEFDVKLLDLLLATPYTSEALANALNVADGTVTTRINRFIEAGIVTGWPRLHRLGLDHFLVLYCELGSFKEPDGLIRNLQAFPRCELFRGTKTAYASIVIPHKWANNLLQEAAILRDEGHRICISHAKPKIARWGIPLEPLWLPPDFLGQRWK